MLSLLKKLAGGAAAPAAACPPAPPAPAPAPAPKVDPYMLGLRDAVLSGWFNQQTG